ncbi:hypothetical protein [Synechococcus sp. MIT S1220]|uniref:hypothetical protein n=1 Tax=Synechococcus sp. MIT S1220 TaxID=3082549 RepID=UPI0039AEFA4B
MILIVLRWVHNPLLADLNQDRPDRSWLVSSGRQAVMPETLTVTDGVVDLPLVRASTPVDVHDLISIVGATAAMVHSC